MDADLARFGHRIRAGRAIAGLFALILAFPVMAGTSLAPLPARVLDTPGSDAPVATVTNGSLDGHFVPFVSRGSHLRTKPLWFRLPALSVDASTRNDPAVIIARTGVDQSIVLFAQIHGESQPLAPTIVHPQFGGGQDSVYVLPPTLDPGAPFYARVLRTGPATTDLHFSTSTLGAALDEADVHSRMIALAFGALMAMALSTLLVRLLLVDRLLPLYGAVFSLQAFYLVYFSGEGFEWPILAALRPLSSYAWNVPAALAGAAAALFVREFANLRLFSAWVYRAFGYIAAAFAVLAVANVLRAFGLGRPIAAIGNLMFLGSALFTLVVAYLAWRRGNRASGWFLIAWSLLCTLQIVTAVYLLYGRADEAAGLLYYGLGPSMVAAAVLIALGVADRMREQNAALTEAERRAQIDPLTGVLNRRSFVERLDAAGARANTRGLPLSVLFIDLDDFKHVNDSRGHAAGDACLAAIIDPIQGELRQSDTIGRYGGDEFVVSLYGADSESAHQIADRVCKRVSDARVEGFGAPIRLTCSIGVAGSDVLGVSGQPLIAHADAAQYAAKRSGRNRVELAAAFATPGP